VSAGGKDMKEFRYTFILLGLCASVLCAGVLIISCDNGEASSGHGVAPAAFQDVPQLVLPIGHTGGINSVVFSSWTLNKIASVC